MSKFAITWGSGLKTEVEASGVATVDAYAMERWGQNSAEEVRQQFGVTIVQVDDEVKTNEVKSHEVVASQVAVQQKAAAVAAAKAEVANKPIIAH